MRRLLAGAVPLILSSVAWAKPIRVGPHEMINPIQLTEPVPATVNSHVLFLNNCRPSGCTVHSGNTNSTTSTSDLASSTSTLTALTSTANWTTVMTCMTQMMSRFNIQVTDVDPGTAPHFEVMIAGAASQILGADSTGVLGVADFTCSSPGQCSAPYIPNALVFDFANDAITTYHEDENFLCGVAAQEIAHAFTLDHTITTSDPMTYNNYTTNLSYQNGMKCGSDCQNGQGPFGGVEPCTGTGGTATHACMSTGQATQDEVTIITNLFGAGVPPPTVAITAPANNANEGVGKAFPITATCTPPSGDSVKQMSLSIDGTASGSTTTSSPATFMAPTTLALGSHTLDVNCTTTMGGMADATGSVTLINSCMQDSDCTTAGDICFQQTCIPGPTGGSGGLGQPCTSNSDCASDQCGNDGTTSLCVVPCDTSMNQCPSGFGCLSTNNGGNAGVCWFGADGGGGGCDTSGDSRSSILLGLSLAGALVMWKRPKGRRTSR